MRPHSDELESVLTAGFSRRLIVDVFHGSDRQLQDLDMTAWSIDWDLSAEVKMQGSGTIVYSSPDGSSLVPEGTDGVLSPFKARLLLLMEIFTDDGFSETITLGWAKVTKIPSAYDTFLDTPTGRVVAASVVQVEFKSLDEDLRRRGFRSPEQPPDLTSAYAEMRRISGMKVTETLTDAVIPTAIVYETSQGGRLKGVQDLAGVLGGVAVVDSSGALKTVPLTAGDPVEHLRVGPDGTVTDVGYSVDTDSVYNVVVGSFEDVNRNPIYVVAEAPAGSPLDPAGDYGENTLPFSSPTVTTKAQADEAVQTRLNTSLSSQTYDVPIQCVMTPLVELGDPLDVPGWSKPVSGLLTKCSMSDSALMSVTLRANRVF